MQCRGCIFQCVQRAEFHIGKLKYMSAYLADNNVVLKVLYLLVLPEVKKNLFSQEHLGKIICNLLLLFLQLKVTYTNTPTSI